jgi:phosphate acetyltransferase
MHLRRFRDVRLCAMTVPNSVKVFTPDRLLIAPADRDDIILAVSLAVMGGMRIAGLVLTGGVEPNERVMQLCAPAFAMGLPVLEVDDGSFQTATLRGPRGPADSHRRQGARRAGHERGRRPHRSRAWLRSVVASRRAQRLSPPAFRQRLVEEARAANKRIVLPEGTEPRTITAASIAQERGIARCVLLGAPDAVQEQARKLGVKLPSSIEIIDPTASRGATWTHSSRSARRAA